MYTFTCHFSFFFFFTLQYINTTGARVCLKELYESKYDPLSVSYTVLSGKNHQNIILYLQCIMKATKFELTSSKPLIFKSLLNFRSLHHTLPLEGGVSKKKKHLKWKKHSQQAESRIFTAKKSPYTTFNHGSRKLLMTYTLVEPPTEHPFAKL